MFQALPMATAAMQATQMIGRPECNVVLAECAVYLARARKNPEVYSAMNAALKGIQGSNSIELQHTFIRCICHMRIIEN